MPRPRFSDMLYERRSQLGLSIKQASNVLRLKEEVLVAFEEGDFHSIPKSGYAQAMLSSYARYLGLNAKTVVNQFQADLIEHERGANSHEARRKSRQNRNGADGPLYQTPQANAYGQGYNNRLYFESRGFLPTSGGFAGDMGDFATTSAARPRYASTAASRDESSDYPQNRPYAPRLPMAPAQSVPYGSAHASTRRTVTGQPSSYGPSYQASRSAAGYDSVSSRRLGASTYADDPRLDSEGRGYQSASSASGRRSTRTTARAQRPNVRRPTTSGVRNQTRGRGMASRSSGLMGMVEEFLSDRTRALIAGAGVLGVILILVIVSTVSSCVRGSQKSERTVAVTASDQATTTEEQETTDVSKEEEEKARAEAAAAKAAENESSATERTLEVTVADGEVTWIEIEYDKKSDIAETVTGPWDRTYTVRQAITIRTNNTAAVTVMEGNKKLEFDDKSSGIGIISIQVSKESDAADKDAADDAAKKDGGATDGDGTSEQATDGGAQDASGDAGQGGYEDWSYDDSGGDDGYIYTEFGYYDPYGNYYVYE